MVVAEKRGVGQPPVVLTDEEEHDYLTAVENGASNRGAAEEAGIGYWITRRMYATDSEFSAKVDTARQVAQEDRQRIVQEQQERLAEREKEFEEALDGLLQFAEAGRRLGKSKEYVRQQVNRGKLPSIRTPFGRLVVVEECDEERFPGLFE